MVKKKSFLLFNKINIKWTKENIIINFKNNLKKELLDLLFLDFKNINDWMDNSLISKCNLCNWKFNFFTRKHHCRMCGNIFCEKCLKNHIIINVDNNFINYFEIKFKSKKNSPNQFQYKLCKFCYEKYLDFISKIVKLKNDSFLDYNSHSNKSDFIFYNLIENIIYLIKSKKKNVLKNTFKEDIVEIILNFFNDLDEKNFKLSYKLTKYINYKFIESDVNNIELIEGILINPKINEFYFKNLEDANFIIINFDFNQKFQSQNYISLKEYQKDIQDLLNIFINILEEHKIDLILSISSLPFKILTYLKSKNVNVFFDIKKKEIKLLEYYWKILPINSINDLINIKEKNINKLYCTVAFENFKRKKQTNRFLRILKKYKINEKISLSTIFVELKNINDKKKIKDKLKSQVAKLFNCFISMKIFKTDLALLKNKLLNNNIDVLDNTDSNNYKLNNIGNIINNYDINYYYNFKNNKIIYYNNVEFNFIFISQHYEDTLKKMLNNFKEIKNDILNNKNDYYLSNYFQLINLNKNKFWSKFCKKLSIFNQNNLTLKKFINTIFEKKNCNLCNFKIKNHNYNFILNNKNINIDFNKLIKFSTGKNEETFIEYKKVKRLYSFKQFNYKKSLKKKMSTKFKYEKININNYFMFIYCLDCNKILSNIINLSNYYLNSNIGLFFELISKNCKDFNDFNKDDKYKKNLQIILDKFLDKKNKINSKKRVNSNDGFKIRTINNFNKQTYLANNKSLKTIDLELKNHLSCCFHKNKIRAIKYKKYILNMNVSDIKFLTKIDLSNINFKYYYGEGRLKTLKKYLQLFMKIKKSINIKFEKNLNFIDYLINNNIINYKNEVNFIEFKEEFEIYFNKLKKISIKHSNLNIFELLNKISKYVLNYKNLCNIIFNFFNLYKTKDKYDYINLINEFSSKIIKIDDDIEIKEYYSERINVKNINSNISHKDSKYIKINNLDKNILLNKDILFLEEFFYKINNKYFPYFIKQNNNLINEIGLYFISESYENNFNNFEIILKKSDYNFQKFLKMIPEELIKFNKINIVLNKKLDKNLIIDIKDTLIINKIVNIKIKEFYPYQFNYLRKIYNIDINKLISNLIFGNCIVTTGGKTNSDFYSTFDKRFLIKKISSIEFLLFFENFGEYLNYLISLHQNNKTSLLVKIFGLFKIRNHYIIIMENLYYGIIKNENILTYDLKGSKINRWIYPKNKQFTRLDFNFLLERNGEPLNLKNEKNFDILEILKIDLDFLSNLKIIDYSVLLIINIKEKTFNLGIIDYLRKYNLSKKIESKFKQIINRDKPTIIKPLDYKNRLLRFIQDNFYFFD